MKRPSRRLRESATTTLKNGRFLAPPRASLMMTMLSGFLGTGSGRESFEFYDEMGIGRKVVREGPPGPVARVPLAQPGQQTLHSAQHLLHPALGDEFHHFLGLLELIQELVDLLH